MVKGDIGVICSLVAEDDNDDDVFVVEDSPLFVLNVASLLISKR